MEKYIILFYDSLRAHMCSKVIDFLKHNIIVVALPAHTTHKLQPLDIILFSCWKSGIRFYFKCIEQDIYDKMRSDEIRCNEYKLEHKLSDILMATKFAVNRSFTTHNIQSSFEKNGIWPLDISSIYNSDIRYSKLSENSIDKHNLLELKNDLVLKHRNNGPLPVKENSGFVDTTLGI